MSLGSDHQAFEERLFPEALLPLFLSGGRIFPTSHISSWFVHFSLHCVFKATDFDQKAMHLNLILLRRITGDIVWYLNAFFVGSLINCYKDHLDLHYHLNFILMLAYKYQHLHVLLSLSIWIKVRCLFLLKYKLHILSKYYSIWYMQTFLFRFLFFIFYKC